MHTALQSELDEMHRRASIDLSRQIQHKVKKHHFIHSNHPNIHPIHIFYLTFIISNQLFFLDGRVIRR